MGHYRAAQWRLFMAFVGRWSLLRPPPDPVEKLAADERKQ